MICEATIFNKLFQVLRQFFFFVISMKSNFYESFKHADENAIGPIIHKYDVSVNISRDCVKRRCERTKISN